MEFFVIDHDNLYSCVKCNEMFLCESEAGIGFAMTNELQRTVRTVKSLDPSTSYQHSGKYSKCR